MPLLCFLAARNSDLTFNLDNEALYEICTKRMGIPAPTYKDL